MIIYKVTNKVNGKCYVGKTVRALERRKSIHLSCARNTSYSLPFYRAIRKYGANSFVWEVVDNTCKTDDELNEMEILCIKKYRSHKTENGYNISLGGSGGDNFTNHPDKERIRRKLRERWSGGKHPWIGRNHTVKSREKIRRKAIGRKVSKETRRKMGKIRSTKVGRKNHLSKVWKIFFPGGEEKVVVSLRNFCNTYKEEKLDFAAMHRTANGIQRFHKGYRCEYVS
jgi:group I intron endonuclease